MDDAALSVAMQLEVFLTQQETLTPTQTCLLEQITETLTKHFRLMELCLDQGIAERSAKNRQTGGTQPPPEPAGC